MKHYGETFNDDVELNWYNAILLKRRFRQNQRTGNRTVLVISPVYEIRNILLHSSIVKALNSTLS